ncbi:hypothetical protein AWB73_00518 [Caballeronia turbans]|jgi:hypothetical protein|nr:hypothetical protein AWB73_00518 [Caballeronia turbans]
MKEKSPVPRREEPGCRLDEKAAYFTLSSAFLTVPKIWSI